MQEPTIPVAPSDYPYRFTGKWKLFRDTPVFEIQYTAGPHVECCGGYIAGPDNVPAVGTCCAYIAPCSIVTDDALVEPDSSVGGYSVVAGSAQLLGSTEVISAEVTGTSLLVSSTIIGGAHIRDYRGDHVVIGGTGTCVCGSDTVLTLWGYEFPVTFISTGIVGVGCQWHSWEQWHELLEDTNSSVSKHYSDTILKMYDFVYPMAKLFMQQYRK